MKFLCEYSRCKDSAKSGVLIFRGSKEEMAYFCQDHAFMMSYYTKSRKEKMEEDTKKRKFYNIRIRGKLDRRIKSYIPFVWTKENEERHKEFLIYTMMQELEEANK